MTNLFVADTKTEAMFEDMDLDTCLNHPRVTKIIIMSDGALVVELSTTEKTDDIIRKTDGLHKANKTGFRGVSLSGKKFRASINEDGVQFYLGTFETMQEAIEARVKAELEAYDV